MKSSIVYLITTYFNSFLFCSPVWASRTASRSVAPGGELIHNIPGLGPHLWRSFFQSIIMDLTFTTWTSRLSPPKTYTACFLAYEKKKKKKKKTSPDSIPRKTKPTRTQSGRPPTRSQELMSCKFRGFTAISRPVSRRTSGRKRKMWVRSSREAGAGDVSFAFKSMLSFRNRWWVGFTF